MKIELWHIFGGALAIVVVLLLVTGNMSGIGLTGMQSSTADKSPGIPTMKLDKTSYMPGDKVSIYIMAAANKLGTGQISYFMLLISTNDNSLWGGYTNNKIKAVSVMPSPYYDTSQGNNFIYYIPKTSALPSTKLTVIFQVYAVDNQGRQSKMSMKTLQREPTVFKVI